MSCLCIRPRKRGRSGAELGRGVNASSSPVWKVSCWPAFQNDPEHHAHLTFLSSESARLPETSPGDSSRVPMASLATQGVPVAYPTLLLPQARVSPSLSHHPPLASQGLLAAPGLTPKPP